MDTNEHTKILATVISEHPINNGQGMFLQKRNTVIPN